MALFNGFFNRLIDSTDDVECEIDNILEDIRQEKSESSNPLPVDENAQVRQQVLDDMERQAEDPIDAFLRRSRERRQSENMIIGREEQARLRGELYSFNPLIPGPSNTPHSWHQRPAFPGYPHDRVDHTREQRHLQRLIRAHELIPPEEFRRLHGIEPSPQAAIRNMARGFHSINSTLKSSGIVKLPDVSTSGNQDYLQLEKLTQEFALSVRALLEAESPADFLIQKSIVQEHTDNILSKMKKDESKEEIPSEKEPGLTIELD